MLTVDVSRNADGEVTGKIFSAQFGITNNPPSAYPYDGIGQTVGTFFFTAEANSWDGYSFEKWKIEFCDEKPQYKTENPLRYDRPEIKPVTITAINKRSEEFDEPEPEPVVPDTDEQPVVIIDIEEPIDAGEEEDQKPEEEPKKKTCFIDQILF